jgi:hypothetical protein
MIVDKVFFYKHTPQSQHISNVLLATFWTNMGLFILRM